MSATGAREPPDAERAGASGADHRRAAARYVVITTRRPRRPARRRRAAFRRLHQARCARCRRRPASRCWCPISAAGSNARSTSSVPTPPDVMNHNLETVPRLYRQARPGADYAHSLQAAQEFKAARPGVPTKCGLMLGLGETDEEILAGDARPARARRGHADDRPVPGAQRTSPAGAALCGPEVFERSRAMRWRWGSSTRRARRWCAVHYHADQQAHALASDGVLPTSTQR